MALSIVVRRLRIVDRRIDDWRLADRRIGDCRRDLRLPIAD
jgi:hypothetical protein